MISTLIIAVFVTVITAFILQKVGYSLLDFFGDKSDISKMIFYFLKYEFNWYTGFIIAILVINL